MPGPAAKGFWFYVEKTPTCWLWRGARKSEGYGVYSVTHGHMTYAHRYAYEELVGPIPTGLVIDHLCRNPSCVKPAHLEPVTQQVNTLRGISPAAINATKTECKSGHPFDSSNTYIKPDGARGCRQCRREATRRWLERKAAS